MKPGFIGLGIMGLPMTINLTCAGRQLHVMAIGPVTEELLSLGAVNIKTARQVTDFADIIFIMVPDTPQIEEVLLGEHGCAKTLLQGKTIVDMSSTSLIETKRFAKQVNELGDDYLDVPVSGGETGARGGTLSITASGEPGVFERIEPLFGILGENITLVGDNGDGQTCKVANQIIIALNIEAASEALVFASKAGADPVRVRQVLMGGFASSRILEIHGERMIKRTFDPGLKIVSHQKDFNLALQSAKALSLNLPNTATCQELFNICAVNGDGQLDHSAMIQALELIANYKLSRP